MSSAQTARREQEKELTSRVRRSRLGLSSVSIRQKFYRPDAMCRAAGDLPENAFIKYKGVLDQLEERLGGVDSTEFWTPILYKWEVSEQSRG